MCVVYTYTMSRYRTAAASDDKRILLVPTPGRRREFGIECVWPSFKLDTSDRRQRRGAASAGGREKGEKKKYTPSKTVNQSPRAVPRSPCFPITKALPADSVYRMREETRVRRQVIVARRWFFFSSSRPFRLKFNDSGKTACVGTFLPNGKTVERSIRRKSPWTCTGSFPFDAYNYDGGQGRG